jgi:hypothetical protein
MCTRSKTRPDITMAKFAVLLAILALTVPAVLSRSLSAVS